MKKLLTYILSSQQRKQRLKPSRSNRKILAYGFTLIELLVAALIASLLVSVLLGFLIGVLDSDRKEAVKSDAQEELQSAANFIADDLQEAIYIYGADGLASLNNQLPHKQTNSQCDDTNCTPVLVFWKRFIYNPLSKVDYGVLTLPPAPPPPDKVKIGCLPYPEITQCESAEYPYAGARYVYSLVAYYLKNDDPTIPSNTTEGFSTTARILRWEIKDGFEWYCGKVPTAKPSDNNTNCPASTTAKPRADGPLSDKRYFNSLTPSQGFQSPPKDISSTRSNTLDWTKYANYNFNEDKFITLVDFMDDSDSYPPVGVSNPVISSSNTGVAPTKNTTCDDSSVGVGNPDPGTTETQRVPNKFDNSDGSNPSRLSSFYACVSPKKNAVRFYLRGSAVARLVTPSISKSQRKPNASNTAFFPTADVRSFGRGTVGISN